MRIKHLARILRELIVSAGDDWVGLKQRHFPGFWRLTPDWQRPLRHRLIT
jgi:hypothetical protein